MADTNLLAQSPFIDPEQQMALTELQRKQQLANLLTQKGMETPQGQMVGNRYVAPSPVQYLANLFNVYSGKNLQNQATAEQAALSKALREQQTKGINEFIAGGQEQPEQAVYGAGEEGPTKTVTQAARPALSYGQRVAKLQQTNPQLANQLLADMLKTHNVAEGSTLQRGNLETGGFETVGKGAEKLPTEYKEYQKAVEGGFKGSFFDYQQALKRAGATNVQVSTEKSYGQQFGQKLADADVNLYQSAQKAPEILANVETTKKLLNDKNIITGFGAQQRLDVARLGSALGIGGKDTKETVANTQQLFANRAQTTLDSIKESGLGAGQGFTNSDREFLEKARLGNITYDKTSLQRQLDIEERVAKATANKWNNRIKTIPQSATGPTGIGPVSIPQTNAPSTGGVKFLGFE